MPSKSSSTTTADVQHLVTKMKTQRPHPHSTRSDQRLIDPNTRPSALSANSSSTTTPRLTPRAAPPSAPLPPLPVPGPSRTQNGDAPPNDQRQADSPSAMSASAKRSFGENVADGKAGMDAGVRQGLNTDSSAASPPVSCPRPLGDGQLTHNTHQQKKEIAHVPESGSTQRHPPSSFPGGLSHAQPPAKSGLLKRLTTRLSGTRSSPSLRPQEAPSVPPSSSNLHSSSPAPTPPFARQNQNQNQNQSLANRLSLAALASHRADRREARAREDQRATDARRAAALAERGLLPASRRYSVAALPVDEEDDPGSFDPFRSDGLGTGRERGSVEGIVVEVVEEGGEGREKVSEAEALIREWRERNTRVDSKNGLGVRLEGSELNALHEGASARAEPTVPFPKTSTRPKDEHTPSTDNLKSGEELTPLPAPPAKKATTTLEVNTKEVSLATPAGKEKAKAKAHAEDVSVKTKEKAALGAWKFPAASPISEKGVAEALTPTGNKKDFLSNSSVCAKTAVVSEPIEMDSEDAALPPPPPPKPKNGVIAASSISPTSLRTSKLPQPPTSPTQISHPTSPASQTLASAGMRAQASSITAPSASTFSQVPASRTRIQAQKQHSVPSTSSSLMPSLPALSPTASTASTSGGSALPRTPSTSSNGHSPVRVLVAPREDEEDALLMDHDESITPTPDNTGFKHAGMKDAKSLAQYSKTYSEADELGALPPLPVNSPSNRGSSTLNVSDMGWNQSGEGDKRKRASLFGRRRTTQTSPPMIVIPESLAGHTAAGKAGEDGRVATSTPAKPRQSSSLTNLRRTVISVTAGLTSATNAGGRASSKTPLEPSSASLNSVSNPQNKASFTGRDRAQRRGATMPTPRPLTSPRSVTSGADSLSPTSYSMSSTDSRRPGVGLRVQALNPTMHSRGSILIEAHAIEDDESRRLSELAFLD